MSTINNATNTNPPASVTAAPIATTFVFQVTGSRANADPNLQVLALDAAPIVTHSSDVEVTDHPVETGSNVSDNARARADTLVLEGFVAEQSIGALSGLTPPPQVAFDQLRKLKDNGTVIQVSTRLHLYPNMVIEHLSFPETVDIGGSLRFTCGLRAVRVVSSQTITPPAARISANKKKSDSKKPTTPATPAEMSSAGYRLQKTTNANNGLTGGTFWKALVNQ